MPQSGDCDFPRLSLVTVGKSAFSNSPKIRSITIGASLTDLGEISFTGANNLETIHVSEKNPVFSSVDGVLLRDGGKELILCPPKNPMTEFIALPRWKPLRILHSGMSKLWKQ